MLRGARTHEGDGITHRPRERETRALELEVARLDLREIEHVVDHGQLVPAGVVDIAEVLGLSRREVAEQLLE